MGGFQISSSSLLALPAFLAPAFNASDFLTIISSGNVQNLKFKKVLEKWLRAMTEENRPFERVQKNCIQTVFVRAAQVLKNRMNESWS